MVIKSKEDYKEYRSSKQREQPEMEPEGDSTAVLLALKFRSGQREL